MDASDAPTEQRVAACLLAVMGADRAGRAMQSADIIAEELLDSFEIVELMAHLEAEFGFVIPADSLSPEAFRTVGAIAVLCRRVGMDHAARSS